MMLNRSSLATKIGTANHNSAFRRANRGSNRMVSTIKRTKFTIKNNQSRAFISPCTHQAQADSQALNFFN